MKSPKFLIALAVAFAAVSCGPKQTYEYPFQNPKLSVDERVENLISLLTPEEKVGLMMNKSISVDRLGIPSYNWWSEACHGVRQDGYTVYPQPIGMAAAFNPEQMYDVFSTVSDEARANWNRSDHNIFNVPMGVTYYPGNPELTFWCPNVNIFRDPRWGRGQETCGEDPYLTGVLGLMTVKGMQGNDDKYFKTHACAKHYAVHSGPEPLRHTYNASVSMRDLWETYLPAFKKLVIEGDVQEVMCAYNRYEGVPCCASDRLLIDILRNKWNYDAIILTDCDAINNFYTRGQHETHPDPLSATVDAVLNGTDLECGKVMMNLVQGLEKGLISEADLDKHLRYTLKGRFELGMFDPAEMLPWADLGEDVISSESNNALAEQAARESMVLLKNNGVLPAARQKVYIPKRHNPAIPGTYGGISEDKWEYPIELELAGHYYDVVSDPKDADFAIVSIQEPANTAGWTLDDVAAGGNGYVPISLQYEDYTATEAREVSIAGGNPLENFTNRTYKGKTAKVYNHDDLIVVQQTRKAMGTKPVVVIVKAGRPVVLSEIEPLADAILISFGVQNQAMLDIISGKAEPSGLLPMQFPASMAAVERQLEDLPRDMECYVDAAGNTYDFAFGLNWSGVINDARVEKYK